MMISRAYIKIKNNDYKIIELLLEETFKDICLTINDNVAILEVENDEAFQQKLINLVSLQLQDLGVQIAILIVPFLNSMFIPYLDNIKGVYTLFNYYLNHLEESKKDIKKIYDSFKEKDIDTLKAFLRCNTNSSLAANELYLHRNSFNYRINKVINNTLMDLRNTNTIAFLNLIFALN